MRNPSSFANGLSEMAPSSSEGVLGGVVAGCGAKRLGRVSRIGRTGFFLPGLGKCALCGARPAAGGASGRLKYTVLGRKLLSFELSATTHEKVRRLEGERTKFWGEDTGVLFLCLFLPFFYFGVLHAHIPARAHTRVHTPLRGPFPFRPVHVSRSNQMGFWVLHRGRWWW